MILVVLRSFPYLCAIEFQILNVMLTIIIKVFAENVDPDSRARLFERRISVPSGVVVDYEGLRRSLAFMFGSKTYVVFEIHN